jgi:ABC-type nitrate/sulfonate/bicarbonate transport system ATPase subunit
MKLKEARKLAINYCEENKCNYTFIAHDDSNAFYLTDSEERHTVFIVNKNGSLNAYRNTQYAVDFHKELKRRKKSRKNNSKRVMSEMLNRDDEEAVG